MEMHTRGETPDRHAAGLVIYADKRKVLAWTLLAFMLVSLFALGASMPDIYERPFPRLLFILLALTVSGATALAGLLRMFSAVPRLIVDHEGIFLESHVLGSGATRWSDITELATGRTFMQGTLTIQLRYPPQFVARQRGLQWLLSRLLLLADHPAVSGRIITGDALLSMSVDELLIQIQQRFHRELAQHGILVRPYRS